jgi:hypothetical protein
MKPLRFLDVLLILIGVGLLAMAALGAPSAVTQSPYAVNSAGATLSALVNPDGTNAVVFFNYGTTTGYGSISSTNSISVTNTAIETQLDIFGLLSRVPYHCRAVMIAGTNTVYGQDVTFTTVNYTYTYDGTGLVACDPTRPQDYEQGSVLGAAIRQLKQQLLGAFQKSHNLDGTLLPGIVTASNLAPGSVTISALDTNLQNIILSSTNTVTGGVSSNLFTLGATWTTNQYVTTQTSYPSVAVTNDFYTIATNAFPRVKCDGSMTFTARKQSASYIQRTITWPVTFYVGNRVAWEQSVTVTVPGVAGTVSASSTIPVSFISAATENDKVRLVLGRVTESGGSQLSTAQQTDVTTLTVTGYQ